jgi:DNA-binding transcriptional ArsR family regulator
LSNETLATVIDIDVIEDPAGAAAALDPVRADLLALLAEPGSATSLGAALGLPRQQVNYHLRILERHGLVRLVEERPKRGLTERVMQATARSYVVAPAALGDSAPDPSRVDRLSARYLVAVAARMVTEVGALARGADGAGKPLATLTIDTEVRFASAADRTEFAAELAGAITALIAKYHDERASRGRWHRLVVAAHPMPTPPRAEGGTRDDRRTR